jgi:hypothetical protein
VKPPLLEGIISKRGNRLVVVRVVLVHNIESPHAWMEKKLRSGLVWNMIQKA